MEVQNLINKYVQKLPVTPETGCTINNTPYNRVHICALTTQGVQGKMQIENMKLK